MIRTGTVKKVPLIDALQLKDISGDYLGYVSETLKEQVSKIPADDPVWETLKGQGMSEDEATQPVEGDLLSETFEAVASAGLEPMVQQTGKAVCLFDFDVPVDGTPVHFKKDQEVTDPAILAVFDDLKAPVNWLKEG